MTLHIALSLLQNLGLCVDFCVAAVQTLCVVLAFIWLSDAIAFEKKVYFVMVEERLSLLDGTNVFICFCSICLVAPERPVVLLCLIC